MLHSGWHDDVVKQGSLADTIQNAAKFGESSSMVDISRPGTGFWQSSFDLAVAQLIF